MVMLKKTILFLLCFSFAAYALSKDDFIHTLNLAKYSACKDVVKHTQQSNNPQIHQSKLKALSSGPFPYRFEITNGYQEGFVYYALLGYSSEQKGDIPFAYRCYQNSLACIDENKSFSHPLPHAEIYLAIGRTCFAAGRYMDAKDWLDNAFLEAGHDKQLQAAIDRVGIQRANEIGDYPEIIFLYQHLEEVSRASQRGLKNTMPHWEMRLTKPELANYSQILFYTRKDREGFGKLLEGISKLGIDNNLGVKDPLVDKFLNNIMRADDDEVKYFYDLLGWAIVDARAKAGDEDFLAFLCNARTLFCKVYDFLNPEDDLKKVKERIDEVKKQLAQGYDVFGDEKKYSVFGNRYLRSTRRMPGGSKLIINKSGEIEKSPEIKIDDLLMLADWKLKQKDYKNAGTNYYLASLIATGKFANLEYDGTTAQNAAIIGMKKNLQFTNYDLQFILDNSYRAAELTLRLYISATNDEQRARYDIEASMKILPKANLLAIKYFKNKAQYQTKKYAFPKAIQNYNEYFKRLGFFPAEEAMQLSAIYTAIGNREKAFTMCLQGLIRPQNNLMAAILLGKQCLKTPGWATISDLKRFPRTLSSCLILPMLNAKPLAIKFFKKAVEWKNREGVEISIIHEAIQKNDINYLTNGTKIILKTAHRIQAADTFLLNGQTNEAFSFYLKAMRHREGLAELIANEALCFPCYESKKLNSLVGNVSEQEASKYLMWLQVKMGKLISGSHRNAKIITKELNAIIMENALLTNYIIPEINLK